MIAECPSCDEHIEFNSRPQLRQHITCPACKERLYVVLLSPEIELDLVDGAGEKPRKDTKLKRPKPLQKRHSNLDYAEGDDDFDDERERRVRDRNLRRPRNRPKRKNSQDEL
jgi:hypothetical protein